MNNKHLLIALGLLLACNHATYAQKGKSKEAKTTFQTSEPWKPETDVRADTRKSSRRRSGGREAKENMHAYVEGTAVRRLEAAPRQQIQKKKNPSISASTRSNRERASQMNVRYVVFLTAAAVATVWMCVNYLQLKAQGTRLQKQVTALETSRDAAILQNDSDYNRIMAGVDMEHVKDVAVNELGMGYATKNQVQTYSLDDSDYVRQYADVPEE